MLEKLVRCSCRSAFSDYCSMQHQFALYSINWVPWLVQFFRRNIFGGSVSSLFCLRNILRSEMVSLNILQHCFIHIVKRLCANRTKMRDTFEWCAVIAFQKKAICNWSTGKEPAQWLGSCCEKNEKQHNKHFDLIPLWMYLCRCRIIIQRPLQSSWELYFIAVTWLTINPVKPFSLKWQVASPHWVLHPPWPKDRVADKHLFRQNCDYFKLK